MSVTVRPKKKILHGNSCIKDGLRCIRNLPLKHVIKLKTIKNKKYWLSCINDYIVLRMTIQTLCLVLTHDKRGLD